MKLKTLLCSVCIAVMLAFFAPDFTPAYSDNEPEIMLLNDMHDLEDTTRK